MKSDIKKIFNLKDIVKYQKNSIVSQTLINKKNGTVTLFSFDQGQGLSKHSAPYDALVLLLEGEVEIIIDGELFHLKENDFIIMPKNIPHALTAVKKLKMILTLIGD